MIETKPADFAGFRGLTVPCFSGQDLAKVSRRNPVLIFARQAVIGNAKQRKKRDFQAHFFAGFSDGALLESFEKGHFAADDAPAAGFRREPSEREEDAALIVGQENADSDPRKRRFRHWRSQDGSVSWLPENGDKTLGQSEGAEKHGDVESVTRKGVPEQGQAGKITSG